MHCQALTGRKGSPNCLCDGPSPYSAAFIIQLNGATAQDQGQDLGLGKLANDSERATQEVAD